MKINSSALPVDSLICQSLPGADFSDCYQIPDLWPHLNAVGPVHSVIVPRMLAQVTHA